MVLQCLSLSAGLLHRLLNTGLSDSSGGGDSGDADELLRRPDDDEVSAVAASDSEAVAVDRLRGLMDGQIVAVVVDQYNYSKKNIISQLIF
jgi:hypothetical protein